MNYEETFRAMVNQLLEEHDYIGSAVDLRNVDRIWSWVNDLVSEELYSAREAQAAVDFERGNV